MAADDIKLPQRNSLDDGFEERTVTPAANTLQGFDNTKLPANVAVGAGLTLAGNTLSATGGGAAIDVEDEGVPVLAASTLNFTGGAVTVTDAGGGVAEIAITGGSSYIDGEVDTYGDLPITVGTPPVDSVYMVLHASGVWLINRKPAGLYVRTGNAGSLSDWTYADAFPDVFSDANFEVYNASDSSKSVMLDVSGVSAATTRTLVVPNANGTIALTGAAPTAHAASHENGGSDEISVAGLSGVLADPQPPIIGAGAGDAVAGNDARLTNERVPTAAGLTTKFGTNKASLVDADKVAILDSAAADAPAHGLWSLVKSTLKTYFDTVTTTLTNKTLTAPAISDPSITGTVTMTGSGATVDNSSATLGTFGSTGGGGWNHTGIHQLSGTIKDSAGSTGTSGYALITNGSGVLTYQFIKRSFDLSCYAYPPSAAITTPTNTAAFLTGNNRSLKAFDSTGYTQARVKIHIAATASNATTTIFVRYHTASSATFADYTVAGAGATEIGVTLSTAQNTTFVGSWVDLTAGAIGDRFWVIGSRDTAAGGLTPTTSQVSVEFR